MFLEQFKDNIPLFLQMLKGQGKNLIFLFLLLAIGILNTFFYFSLKGELHSTTVLTNIDGTEPNPEFTSDKSYVDISGAVANPGVYEMFFGDKLVDALNKAGGVSNEASIEWLTRNLNLAKSISTGEKIYIPFEWDILEKYSGFPKTLSGLVLNQPDVTENTQKEASLDENTGEDATTDEESSFEEGISINNATKKELESLPGIGSVTADKIISNRPYEHLEELKTKTKLSNTLYLKIESLVIL